MDIEIRNEHERLVVEQALLSYRAVERAMEQAPWGQGLAVTERAALAGSRETGRRMIDEALEARAQAEKGGRVAGAAEAG